MLESHVSRRVFEFLQVLFPLPRASKEHILFSADLGQLLLSIRHEWCQKKQKSHHPNNGETCMLEPHVSRGVFEILQVLFPLSRASKEHILLFPAGLCCCHLFYKMLQPYQVNFQYLHDVLEHELDFVSFSSLLFSADLCCWH